MRTIRFALLLATSLPLGACATRASVAGPAAKPAAEAGGESVIERMRHREAVVIWQRSDRAAVKGAGFGTMLVIDPPTASLPPLR